MLKKSSTLKEIYNHECLKDVKAYLIGNGEGFYKDRENMTLEELQKQIPAYNPEDILYGLNRLISAMKEGTKVLHSVYDESEIFENPDKANVKLFWLPALKKSAKQDTYVLLMAGGAYECVATMLEAFPVAAKLNEMGFSVFCLDYRTMNHEKRDALFPKPMDDVAAAWNYIKKHAEKFQINPNQYMVGGFSAGGHLAGMWGTKEYGFRKYDIPGPEMLLLDYPLISFRAYDETAICPMLCELLGDDYTQEMVDSYCIEQQIDEQYPVVYHVQCEDDDIVPPINYHWLKEAIENHGKRFFGELAENGGHGFGLGTATKANGWVERAIISWKVNRILERLFETGELTGAILYLHQDGKTILKNKWGYENIDKKTPLSYENSIFRMASMSKVLTGAGILKLMEQGKIGLDDELCKYLPEFTDMQVINDFDMGIEEAFYKYIVQNENLPEEGVKFVPANRKITIRDLLTHSSGLEMGVYGMINRIKNMDSKDCLKERVKKLSGLSLDFQPGAQTGYSPIANFDVLGRVIEVITGEKFGEFMEREIFHPLEMYHTFFQVPEQYVKHLVPLYKPVDGKQIDVSGTEEDMLCGLGGIGSEVESGSAGVHCTAEDYDHFTQMLHNEGCYHGKQILKPETIQKMRTETAYEKLIPEPGMEWALSVKVCREPQLSYMNTPKDSYGWSGAFGTEFVISPKTNTAMTFIMNRSDIGGSASYICRELEKAIFGDGN